MTNEELVARIKANIDTAENMLALWEQNRRFIHVMALKYKGYAEPDDLEQEGYLALNDAVRLYDSALGVPFINYAARWIKHRMLRYIQNSGTVRIPVHEGEKLKEYKRLVNAYHIRLGRKPTRHELARDMNLSYKMIANLEETDNLSRLRSLDSLMTAEEDGITVGDLVPDDVNIEADVLENVQQEQLRAVLWPLVDALPDNQGKVLRQRFQDNRTLRETGESIGATVEQTRQLEAKALRGLRCSRSAGLLRAFLTDEKIYSMGVRGNGVGNFNRTWTSSTEKAALKLLE